MRKALTVLFYGMIACTLINIPALGQGLKIGDPAPNFTLEDQTAYRVSFTDFRGKMVVLEWINPDCPYVQRHYEAASFKNLAQKFRGNDFVYIAINSTSYMTKDNNYGYLTANNLPYSILDDHDGKVAQMYGATTTPSFFIFDKNHKLVYKGAFDNNPKGDNPQNVLFVEKALNELRAGKPVSTPESKLYGCKIIFGK